MRWWEKLLHPKHSTESTKAAERYFVIPGKSPVTFDTSTEIREIDLTDHGVNKRGALALVKLIQQDCCKNLEWLNLDDNQIDDESGASIIDAVITAKLQHLKVLILTRNKVGHRTAAAFVRAVESGVLNPKIAFGLEHNHLNDHDASIIASALTHQQCPPKLSLNISYNRMTDRGAQHLYDALASHSILDQRRVDVGGKHISESMEKNMRQIYQTTSIDTAHGALNVNLSYLSKSWFDLKGYGMTDAGANNVAQILKRRSYRKVKALLLSYNNIGDAGLISIINAIRETGISKIDTLHLDHNQIGNAGMIALMQAITDGFFPRLETLHLSYNGISNKGVKALAHLLESGRANQLRDVRLEDNKFTTRPMAAIARAITHPNCPKKINLDFSGNEFITTKAVHMMTAAIATGNVKSGTRVRLDSENIPVKLVIDLDYRERDNDNTQTANECLAFYQGLHQPDSPVSKLAGNIDIVKKIMREANPYNKKLINNIHTFYQNNLYKSSAVPTTDAFNSYKKN